MDPPPMSAAADSLDPSLNPANAKLRLMCSYGGHIVPRPHDKSLFYTGGETRIVAVDRRTTAATLSSLTAHLSRTLYNNRPFFLKYQLPNEDLDSLISVTTDDDLHNMLEELDRVEGSPKPTRIRLFLFPSKAESVGSVLTDSKAESWFCDVLKSTKIMQRGHSADSGLVIGSIGMDCGAPSEVVEGLSNSGEGKCGLDLGSVPESMVLETSSSFGSTSSSISMSNLPPIGVHGDDGGVNLLEKRVKVPPPDSVESDNSIASAIPHAHATVYQDLVHIPSMESRVSFNAVETESVPVDAASGIQMMKTVQLPAHPVFLQSDQTQNQQQMPYVQAGAHYFPQFSVGQVPISSYYPMYYSPLHQQTHNPYQPNQPYPVYLMPVRPTQPYNMSMQCNVLDTATAAPSRPQMHPPSTMIAPPVAYKEVMAAPPPPELATKVYRTVAGATPVVQVPSNQNQQPLMDLSEITHPSQTVATANYDNEYEDELAYTQIYKTQPSAPPALLSQYQTMTNAGTVLLSEASKLLQQGDNVKQHIGTSQPQ